MSFALLHGGRESTTRTIKVASALTCALFGLTMAQSCRSIRLCILLKWAASRLRQAASRVSFPVLASSQRRHAVRGHHFAGAKLACPTPHPPPPYTYTHILYLAISCYNLSIHTRRRFIKLHYNHLYPFLRASIKEVVDRYNLKWHNTLDRAAAAANIRHNQTASPAGAVDSPTVSPGIVGS